MASTGKQGEGHLERTAAEPRDRVKCLFSSLLAQCFLFFTSLYRISIRRKVRRFADIFKRIFMKCGWVGLNKSMRE